MTNQENNISNQIKLVTLIDFGSTYTKVALVDLDNMELVGKHQSYTTVTENIMIGLQNAVSEFPIKEQDLIDSSTKIACSSAAGGLRIVAIGLVPSLTVEAAKRAALGAGAKIVATFGYELSESDMERIKNEPCDLVLLAGGTDGGNKESLLRNAEALISINNDIPIVVAGNKVVNDKAVKILKSAGRYAVGTENILPSLDELNVEPARQIIRDIFMSRIVKAKGIDRAQKYVDGILMPTPMATLEAGRLIAQGTGDEPGLGDLMIVEIGGATTNIHSLASGQPTQPSVSIKGLPEPYAKRTVEGDLGIRYNAHTILEKYGVDAIIKNIPFPELIHSELNINEKVELLTINVDLIPQNIVEHLLDTALAKCAVSAATERHCGTIKEICTLQGTHNILFGKDLSEIPKLIGTGGIFAYGQYPGQILESALFSPLDPSVLKPKNPELLVDKDYLIYGIGLLSQLSPTKALRIAKKYLVNL